MSQDKGRISQLVVYDHLIRNPDGTMRWIKENGDRRDIEERIKCGSFQTPEDPHALVTLVDHIVEDRNCQREVPYGDPQISIRIRYDEWEKRTGQRYIPF